MVIDPSAILAIIYAEPEGETFLNLIAQSENCLLASPSYVEASIVLGTRHGEAGVESLNLLLKKLSIVIVPFSPEQAKLATEAFLKFGKGRHPAKLNMGDCFSYALAKAMSQPLLFKGNDFSQTDIDKVNYELS
ncbi:MAG: type II toxin-antitoxin system VapC family toxin [Symploca sp. SIO1B1]|nr:type II toxin-antitoxin system VapC family toxin [Symploca sp. SIO2D2]NER98605.1 type II toxin-antitoxin system VapC family toxin [Symploca sp. SIO1B1]